MSAAAHPTGYESMRQVERSQHDVLLGGVAEAARRLLSIADFDSAVNGALDAIATASGIDRIYIFQNHIDPDSGDVVATIPYEWTAPGVISSRSIPGHYPMSYTDFGDWPQAFRAGQAVQSLARELSAPAQALQALDNALSLLTVPILIEGNWWGVIGFDDCTTERIWNDAEIAVLETAAACIGSAIERQAQDDALRESENRFRELFEASNDNIHFLDFEPPIPNDLPIEDQIDRIYSSSRFTDINPANAKTLNLSRSEALGQPLTTWHSPDSGGHRSLMRQFVENDWQVINAESEDVGPDGKNRYWLSNLFGSTENGHTVRAWGITSNITPLKEAQQALLAAEQDRNQRLQTIATLANQLLRASNYTTVLPEVLRVLGETAGSDRCSLVQNIADPVTGQLTAQMHTEWCRAGIAPFQEHTPDLDAGLLWEPLSESYERLAKGETLNLVVNDLAEPVRSLFLDQGNVTMLIVPIVVRGEFWGVFGFNYCQEAQLLDEADQAVFAIAADSIAAAIERDLTQRAQEQAAQQRAAELDKHNQLLRRRDLILEATAAASEVLLTEIDFDTAINTALQILGESIGCDRIGVGQQFNGPDGKSFGFIRFLYEWHSSHTHSQLNGPSALTDFHWQEMGLEDWFEAMTQGEAIGKTIDELPDIFRQGQQLLDVQSTHNVPIFVEGRFWGVFGIDHCREKKLLTETELVAFKTAASCVGSAIAQERMRQARQAAERNVLREREAASQERAKLLGSVAEAANLLLRAADYETVLPELVRLLGEATGSDRCGIFQEITIPFSQEPGMVVVAEWCNTGIERSEFHTPDLLKALPCKLLPEFYEPFLAGEICNVLVADLQEPARTIFLEQGNTAMICVPIVVDDQPWGVASFDNCGEPRLYDESEIAILQIAAESIASAISRQAQNKALRNAERAVLEEREKAARDRAAQLSRSNQALKRSLDLLAQQPELDAFLQGVVNEATTQTGADSGHLFLYDADIRSCRLHVSTDNNGDWRSVPDMSLWLQPVPVDEAPLFWEKMFERKALVLEDMQTNLKPGPHIWEPSIAWHLQRGHTSTICTPLLLDEQVLGFFGLAFVGETNITQEDVELAQALTNQATLAIQFTRLAEEAKQAAIFQEQEKAARDRATELAKANEAIAQTLNALTETPELETFLGQIMTTISETVNACKVHLFLYDEATDTLNQHITVQDGRIYPGAGPGDPEILRHPIPSDITGAWQVIVESEKPFTLDARYPESAELYWPSTVEWHQEQGHVSAACACMKVGNKPIGFIGFAFRHLPVLTDEQLEFIQALTNQATLSIHLTRLAKQAQATALTDERNRLAREIHDTLAQAFTGVSLHLEAVRGLTSQPDATVTADSLEKAQIYIRRARDLARRGLSEARRSVRALRSQALETDDLPDALRKTLDQTTRHTNLATAFHLEGDAVPLSDDIQLNLLRIAQEATTNALRHAKATQLDLTLSFTAEHIRLRIVDNGTGFDTATAIEKGGFGLIGIRERTARFYGTFDLQSRPGVGTMLDVMMPLFEPSPRIDPLS